MNTTMKAIVRFLVPAFLGLVWTADLMAQLPTIPPAIMRVTPPGIRRGSSNASAAFIASGRSIRFR